MKNRSAESTLLGFYYQFDKTIQVILEASDENSQITVEGIEDVDIKTVTEETAIQIKYQAETKGTDSVLRKPIMLMLEHYKNNQLKGLIYHLYGHYKNNSTVKTTFDFPRIQKMMQYKHIIKGKKVQCDFLVQKSISQQEVEGFLKKFEIKLSGSFDEHQKHTLSIIKKEMKVSKDEEAEFYYNNALKVVYDLSIKKGLTKRKITKKEFKNNIDTKEPLFNIWFIQKNGIDKYCKILHNKYFKSSLNTTKKERFFILPNDNIDNIKNVIYAIEEKFYKTANKEIKSGAPYIIVKDISKQDLISLKKSIYNESKIISDGVPFLGADFQIKVITQESTKENKISIKIINEIQLQETISSIQITKEIYQFYIDKKEVVSAIDSTNMQINECKNISQIIKGS